MLLKTKQIYTKLLFSIQLDNKKTFQLSNYMKISVSVCLIGCCNGFRTQTAEKANEKPNSYCNTSFNKEYILNISSLSEHQHHYSFNIL